VTRRELRVGADVNVPNTGSWLASADPVLEHGLEGQSSFFANRAIRARVEVDRRWGRTVSHSAILTQLRGAPFRPRLVRVGDAVMHHFVQRRIQRGLVPAPANNCPLRTGLQRWCPLTGTSVLHPRRQEDHSAFGS
jgi:hypothetical protein